MNLEIASSFGLSPSPWMITVVLWLAFVCWALFEVVTKAKGQVLAQVIWCAALVTIPVIPPLAWLAWGRKEFARSRS